MVTEHITQQNEMISINALINWLKIDQYSSGQYYINDKHHLASMWHLWFFSHFQVCRFIYLLTSI